MGEKCLEHGEACHSNHPEPRGFADVFRLRDILPENAIDIASRPENKVPSWAKEVVADWWKHEASRQPRVAGSANTCQYSPDLTDDQIYLSSHNHILFS